MRRWEHWVDGRIEASDAAFPADGAFFESRAGDRWWFHGRRLGFAAAGSGDAPQQFAVPEISGPFVGFRVPWGREWDHALCLLEDREGNLWC